MGVSTRRWAAVTPRFDVGWCLLPRMGRVQEVVAPSGDVVRRKPRHGDYLWDGEVWRRWSGRRWARAAYSLHPEQLLSPTRIDEHPTIDVERGRRALSRAVEDQVASNAASVVHDGPSGVILGYHRPVSHVFHAVMTLITAGLWGVVWLALALPATRGSRPLRHRPLGQRLGHPGAGRLTPKPAHRGDLPRRAPSCAASGPPCRRCRPPCRACRSPSCAASCASCGRPDPS